MEKIILLSIPIFITALIFAVITFIKKFQRKDYIRYYRIFVACLVCSVIMFVIGAGNGDLSIMLFFISLLLSAAGTCLFIVALFKKIFKRPFKNAKRNAIIFTVVGILLFPVSVGGDISGILNLFSLLFFALSLMLLLLNIFMTLLKKAKKILWVSVPVCILLGIVLTNLSNVFWQNSISQKAASGEIYEKPIKITYDFEVVDGETPVEVVTSSGFDYEHSRFHVVYDVKDFHLLLEADSVTATQCIDAILNNDKIDSKFKEYFSNFIERMDEKYPGFNFAILYNNLKTLEVKELNRREYLSKSLSMDSLGCYRNDENIIYIPEGTKYIEGEFGFQVLIHEFCHAARTSWYKEGDLNCKLVFTNTNENQLLMEAMNSVFSCSLLNYYEWDIAYQVPSNYLRIMLECMDNYNIVDYMNHGDTYFLSKLDEYTGNINYAQVIWKLITLQRSDWEDESIDIPAEEYYPIYDFLCEMYYKKYLSENLSEDEMKTVADELVYKAFYDAPEDYKIDKDYFYEYLENRLQ